MSQTNLTPPKSPSLRRLERWWRAPALSAKANMRQLEKTTPQVGAPGSGSRPYWENCRRRHVYGK